MIHKIVNIKGVGRFVNYNSGTPYWDGFLGRINAIYADNGSGKTTLTQLFHSVKQKNSEHYIQRRKSFGFVGHQEALWLLDDNKPLKLNNGKWNKHLHEIEVFDTYFVEDNVYLIALGNIENSNIYQEIVIGDDAIKLIEQVREEYKKRKTLKLKIKALVKYIPKILKHDIKDIKQKELEQLREERRIVNKKISNIEKDLEVLADEFGRVYLDRINETLSVICPELKLTKLNKQGRQFVYYIKIGNHELRSESTTISLRHALSEGEKNALAFAFFVARLYVKPNIDKQLVVFD